MKRVLTAILTLSSIATFAQPWVQPGAANRRFSDIVAAWRHEKAEEKAEGQPIEEDGDYHFERWAWYWGQHLDENGYMVPASRTWQEWQTYLAKHPKGAQKTTATDNWVFRGPDYSAGGYSGVGRINAIALHPYSDSTIYAGSAGGGVWKTTNMGRTWAPLYNNMLTLGVSDIVVNQQNPNTIYVCTGDANGYGTNSMGVIKTTDGGATWRTIWSPSTYSWTRSIVMNPADTATLVLGTSTGIYITHDAGTNWSRTDTGDYVQVLYKPNDTTTLYASRYATWPATSAQIMRSTNGGATWNQVTNFTNIGRIAMAVTPANTAVVKAIATNRNTNGLAAIYSSSNSGASFTAVLRNDTPACRNNLLGFSLILPTTSCGGQGWYDLCIAVDPTDANKVTVGGVNNYLSTDGGANWRIISGWWAGVGSLQTVHADKHCLVYSPRDRSLYQGCDGGIYRTTDPASSFSWVDLTDGMGVTQFYRNAVSSGTTVVLGGAQDNGTKKLNGTTYADLTGGDGMQCRIDYDDPTNTWYTATQYGHLNRTLDGGANFTDIRGNLVDSNDGIWITPYILHPRTSTTLLYGLYKLYVSYDKGDSWSPISGDFSRTDKVEHISMTQANTNYIYLSLTDRSVRFSPDFGGSWQSISTSGFTNNISRLAADPANPEIVWATFSGYSATEKVAYYNRTTRTWTRVNGTLPNIPVNCIVIDTFSRTKYIGTDVAIFYMDTTMTDWQLYNTNLPSVEVTDLNINYETGELWAATYGRGMWKTRKRELPNGISVIPYREDALAAAPNPTKGSFTLYTDNTAFAGRTGSVKLMDATGKIVWQEAREFDGNGATKMDVKGLAPGIYICEATSGALAARCRISVYP